MKVRGLKPATPEAYALLQRGAIAMARLEATGLRIDTAYLEQSITDVKKRIADLESLIHSSKEYKLWTKTYGNETNLEAPKQLGRVIFDILGHKRNPFMVVREVRGDDYEEDKEARERNNEAAFEHLRSKIPFINYCFEAKKLRKALGTYLYGIQREVIDGYVHPFFDLHTTRSYRPSCSMPNFQNQPVRNKLISKIIRSCVIPRKDHELLEVDYSTQEVRTSYFHNKDKNLLYDIMHGDMHRDRSKELFFLTDADMDSANGKMCRYIGKNKFVFLQFYGGHHTKCAPDLWDAISLYELKTAEGVSLFEHLKKNGIKRLGDCEENKDPIPGTFEYHVKKVQDRMWKERYPTYSQWKEDWWHRYQINGGFNTFTGFCIEGVLRRNQVLCIPIQGCAFHILLWSVIEIQQEMLRKKMRSKIINQVHDNMLIDTYKRERSDVIELIQRIALKKVAEHYKWISCPLAMEFELCADNWYNKVPLEVAP